MYIVKEETFEQLPDEAKQMIKENCAGVSDPEKQEAIEELAHEPKEDDMEEMVYGDEGEYKTKMDKKGRFEMPESEKNSIKSFDDAADKGNALIVAVSNKPKKTAKPIPETKEEE